MHQMYSMSALSVVIITYNEEKNIARCLQSVQPIADDIVVVDSGSQDNTRNIAERFGARIIVQPFLGYIEQKNFALDQARHEFVLSLDADEALSPQLLDSIVQLKKNGFTHMAYRMNRCSNYCGRWIRNGSWYPDRKVRLFNRLQARWGGINPHDRIILSSGKRPTQISGDILHYTYYNIEEHIDQINRFSSIQASAMLKQGRRSNWIKLLVNPAVAFIGGYVFKMGFLDGWDGLMIARGVSYLTFLKYAKLLHLQRKQEAGLKL